MAASLCPPTGTCPGLVMLNIPSSLFPTSRFLPASPSTYNTIPHVPQGFYGVYSTLFEKLARQEAEAFKSRDEDEERDCPAFPRWGSTLQFTPLRTDGCPHFHTSLTPH